MSEKAKSEKSLTSAEVRAKHKEFLFPSVANYYGDESVVLESGKGLRVKDLDGNWYYDGTTEQGDFSNWNGSSRGNSRSKSKSRRPALASAIEDY